MPLQTALAKFGFALSTPRTNWVPVVDARPSFRKLFATKRLGKIEGDIFYITVPALAAVTEALARLHGAELTWKPSTNGTRKHILYPGIRWTALQAPQIENLMRGIAEAISANLPAEADKPAKPTAFFINSDARSNGGVSYHDDWIFRGIAVVSGDTNAKFDTLSRGDTLLLWANGLGVVAAGRVLDECSRTVAQGKGTVSPKETQEYHRAVDWYADLRAAPISSAQIAELRGSNPLSTLTALQKGREAILLLVDARAEQIDIEEIHNTADGRPTSYETLCQARRGQGKYREDLLNLWDRKCAVSGCDVEPALRASHAKPWRLSTDEERLDPNNGLPLLATIDALFDRGLIGFADDGAMLCAPALTLRQREILGLPLPLRRALSTAQKLYLQSHRERFDLR